MIQDVVKIEIDLETNKLNISVNTLGVNEDALVGIVGSLEKVKQELLKGVKIKT
jgi:hypothetical protein